MALKITTTAKTNVGTDTKSAYVKINDVQLMYPNKQNKDGFCNIGFRVYLSEAARKNNADPVNLIYLDKEEQLPNGIQALATEIENLDGNLREQAYAILAAKLNEIGFTTENC